MLQNLGFVCWFYGIPLRDVLNLTQPQFIFLLAWAEWWFLKTGKRRRG